MNLLDMTADVVRVSEQDRGAALDLLKEGYTDGIIDHVEFDRRVEVILLSSSTAGVEGAVGDLKKSPAVTPRKDTLGLAKSILAASAVGVVLFGAVGFGLSSMSAPSAADDPICISTGIMSDILECPAPTAEQNEIEQYVEIAESAAQQAGDLASGASNPTADQAALVAESAASQARQALLDGQAIMATSLGEEPTVEAFDEAMDMARASASEAVQGLNDA